MNKTDSKMRKTKKIKQFYDKNRLMVIFLLGIDVFFGFDHPTQVSAADETRRLVVNEEFMKQYDGDQTKAFKAALNSQNNIVLNELSFLIM